MEQPEATHQQAVKAPAQVAAEADGLTDAPRRLNSLCTRSANGVEGLRVPGPALQRPGAELQSQSPVPEPTRFAVFTRAFKQTAPEMMAGLNQPSGQGGRHLRLASFNRRLLRRTKAAMAPHTGQNKSDSQLFPGFFILQFFAF